MKLPSFCVRQVNEDLLLPSVSAWKRRTILASGSPSESSTRPLMSAGPSGGGFWQPAARTRTIRSRIARRPPMDRLLVIRCALVPLAILAAEPALASGAPDPHHQRNLSGQLLFDDLICYL